MPRINLSVPYSEKDAAKRLGARWDTTEKVWYIPHGIKTAGFEKWLPLESKVDAYEIVSDSYIIMQSNKPCWSCGEITNVCGLMLPPMHKELRSVAGQNDDWIEEPNYPAMLSQITRLEPGVAERMGQVSALYQMGRSNTLQASYWMNHCALCGQKQGDFHLYEEPGGAFDVTDVTAAEKISLVHVREPFACDGSASYILHDNLLWHKFVVEQR